MAGNTAITTITVSQRNICDRHLVVARCAAQITTNNKTAQPIDARAEITESPSSVAELSDSNILANDELTQFQKSIKTFSANADTSPSHTTLPWS
jgi:hypothetical protein